MLTLRDIDAMTEYSDGSGYSDLYKEVYGCRPRNVTFASLEAFNEDYEFLSKQSYQLDQEEKIRQDQNWIKFLLRIADIMELVQGVDKARAVEILAEAENELQPMQWYGYGYLEFHLGLKYDTIKQWVEDDR